MSQATLLDSRQFLARKSFIELDARERAQALLDEGIYRELLGPFDRVESPWLPMQGVVPQADDGVIVARGRIGGKDSVILAIEGKFQGGSTGGFLALRSAQRLTWLKKTRKEAVLFKSFCFWKPAVFVFRKRTLVWKPSPKLTHRSSPYANMFQSSVSLLEWLAASAECPSPPRFAVI